MAENDIRRKVLIVDDEPNVRRLSHMILSKKFDVFEAENGIQAIEMAKAQKPDIILMDMMMPKMDGLTACQAIRNDPEIKSIPIIMVTAVGFELNMKLSQQMGSNGYLTKPFSPQELIEKTTQVLTDPSGS